VDEETLRELRKQYQVERKEMWDKTVWEVLPKGAG
jgi:hypothetical protein